MENNASALSASCSLIRKNSRPGASLASPVVSESHQMQQPDYERYAQYYDYFELAGFEESEELNEFFDELFALNSVKAVVDFSCGTGAQSIGLARKNYEVTAADINPAMLKLAKKKAANVSAKNLKFIQADMRTARLGTFDAAISIFNAIGHLTKKECSHFFNNAFNHLHNGGLFIADILNFTALQQGAFDQYSNFSREITDGNCLIQHARQSELDEENKIITIRSSTRFQDGVNDPTSVEDCWQMQIYDREELESMLKNAGFGEIMVFSAAGAPFEEKISDNILLISQKP